MAKKKYRIYKAGGAQGQVMNPTAQFLARAQQGMQQPSEDEMLMMQQQQAAQEAASGNPEMMEKLMGAINAAFQNGATPEQVTAKLLEDQVDPEVIAEAFVGLGMEPGEAQEIISTVIQQLQSAQEGPSEEEMMAMQEQQMVEEAPAMEEPTEAPMMKKGAFVKKKLKRAQEGIQQMSNTNLAAEDSVNNVSQLIDYSKTNTLKNQFEQEYDQMMANQNMIPEARLGREARMQRREERRDLRDERRAARQAGRAGRQMQRAYRQAYRKLATPPGMVPGFSAYSPSPFMGGSLGSIDFEGERGLFGRLKNFKMHIDGMGFPMHFSNGMFLNGLYNPYGMPQGQQRIVRKIQTPGEVIDITAKEKEDKNKGDATVNNSNNDGTSAEKSSVKDDVLADLERGMKNVGDIENSANALVDADTESLPVEIDDKELNKVINEDETTPDNAVYWWLGAGGTLLVGDVILTTVALRRARNKGAKTLKEAAEMEGRAATEAEKAAAKSPQAKGRYATWKENWLKSKKQTRSPLTGKFQKKPTTLRGYAGQKAANIGRQGYKYLSGTRPARYISGSKPVSFGKRVGKFILSRGRKWQEGGFVDPMDPDYGNPDLYRFTGGGDFDYFGDQAYIGYEDMPMAYNGIIAGNGDDDLIRNQSNKAAVKRINEQNKADLDVLQDETIAKHNEWLSQYTQPYYESPYNPTLDVTAEDAYNWNYKDNYDAAPSHDAAQRWKNVPQFNLMLARDPMFSNPEQTFIDYSGSSDPNEEGRAIDVPYQYGGIPMAFDGYTVTKDPNFKDDLNEDYMSPAEDRFGKATRSDLMSTLSPEQRSMYDAILKRQQGSGQRGGYRGYGYGQYPYRRGVFNTMMGIQAPAAIRRAGSWLSPWSGPTYSDGTPVMGGIPSDAQLSTIEYNRRGIFERMFPGKDEQGNRIARGPKKSIKYTFNVPGSTTPSLIGKDNKISNFQMSTVNRPNFSTPDQQYNPNLQEPTYQQQIEGDGSEYDDMIMNDAANMANQQEGMSLMERMKARKNKGKAGRRSAQGMTPTGDGKFIDAKGRLRYTKSSAPTTMSADPGWKDYGTEGFEYNPSFDANVYNQQKSEFDAGDASNRQLRQMGFKRKERQAYKENPEMASSMRRERMQANRQYGGYQEGDEVFMTPDEVAQFMAAGGQIEFL